MTSDESWPLPGHHSYYAVTEGDGTFTYDLSIPAGLEKIDLATARVARHGGVTARDEEFRQKLYFLIGGVAVQGGHVESAMKRVILQARELGGDFSIVDKTWTQLAKDIERLAASDLPIAPFLRTILNAVDMDDAKRRRDNVIHAYWWDYDLVDGSVRRGRFHRDGSTATLIGTLQDLADDANALLAVAEILDDLVASYWPQIRLPASDGESPMEQSRRPVRGT